MISNYHFWLLVVSSDYISALSLLAFLLLSQEKKIKHDQYTNTLALCIALLRDNSTKKHQTTVCVCNGCTCWIPECTGNPWKKFLPNDGSQHTLQIQTMELRTNQFSVYHHLHFKVNFCYKTGKQKMIFPHKNSSLSFNWKNIFIVTYIE